jgi:hypothetical protein
MLKHAELVVQLRLSDDESQPMRESSIDEFESTGQTVLERDRNRQNERQDLFDRYKRTLDEGNLTLPEFGRMQKELDAWETRISSDELKHGDQAC